MGYSRVALVSALIAMALLLGSSSAYTTTGVKTMLQGYGVPNAIIGGLTYVNSSYSGHQYVLLYSGTTLDFVVNVTSGYSLETNASAIEGIIQGPLLAQSIQQANFTKLIQEVRKYQASSAPNISDCLVETGLNNPNASCTNANQCESCHTTTLCQCALLGCVRLDTGGAGYGSPFEDGIMWFEANLTVLENSYNSLYASANAANADNIAMEMPRINASFNNITYVSEHIGQNPIFPPNASDSFANCAGSGAITIDEPIKGPWWCNAIPICQTVVNNYTALHAAQGTIESLAGLSLTSAQIDSIAVGVVTNTNIYLGPIIQKQKGAVLGKILNTTLANYNVTVSEVSTLLSHINNASLSATLTAFTANASNVKSNYINLNLTKQNRSLAEQKTALLSAYAQLHGQYTSLTTAAANNTAILVSLQQSGNNNPQISALSFEQAQINANLSGKISNVPQQANSINQISLQLSALGASKGGSPDYLHGASAGIASAIVPAFNMPYSQSVGIAPFAATIPAIIIALIVIAAVGMMYMNGSKPAAKGGKMGTGPKKQQMHVSLNLLIIVVILMILLVVVSYAYAASANSSAPTSSFTAAYQNSNSLAIVLNGTVTSGMTSCAQTIRSDVSTDLKTPINVTVTNDKCVVNGGTPQTTESCLSSFASKQIPVIMLINGSTSSISLYSYYGTVLKVTGDSADQAKCSASLYVS